MPAKHKPAKKLSLLGGLNSIPIKLNSITNEMSSHGQG